MGKSNFSVNATGHTIKISGHASIITDISPILKSVL